jgi:hypothetical protein
MPAQVYLHVGHAVVRAPERRRGVVLRALLGRVVRPQRRHGVEGAETAAGGGSRALLLCQHRQRLTRASPPRRPQDILLEALKGALVLAVLERLYVTRNSAWVRDVVVWRDAVFCSSDKHAIRLRFFNSLKSTSITSVCRRVLRERYAVHALDDVPRCASLLRIAFVSLSTQALLFKQTGLGFTGQIRVFFRHTRRLN